MAIVWVVVGAALSVGTLVVLASHRMLTRRHRPSAGTADALGNFIDVFDPARSRAERDLASHRNMGAVLPSPDDEDLPVWKVDLQRRTVRIPRPR